MEADGRNEYQEYLRRTAAIRSLSEPSLEDIDNADDFARKLRGSFRKIGELAAQNRDFLENELYPLLNSEAPLEDEDLRKIAAFSSDLTNARSSESLDLPIMSVLSERLLSEAEDNGDIPAIIRQMDARIGTFYGLMNMSLRLEAYPEIANQYRAIGFSIGDFFFNLLDKSHFVKITDPETRRTILTDARYSMVFFERISGDRAMCGKVLEKLDFLLELERDPWYREAVPEYDWLYYHYRVLQYYALAAERDNAAGFTKDELALIYGKTKELCVFYDAHESYFREHLGGMENRRLQEFLLCRNGCLAGEIDPETCRTMLENAYNTRKTDDYSSDGGYLNLFVPQEIILMIGKGRLSARDQQQLYAIYHSLISYAFHLPNSESFSVLLEPYADCLNNFIEMPSGITFENMVLQLMAAFHPPTYLHSLMVGQISECLCRHLVMYRPELLTGVLGCGTREEVQARADEIIAFAYHAGLCHDFGKIMIIDTIFVYGRKLLDMEFGLIRAHPKTGHEMLKRYPSTRAYAEIALGHHRWHDGSHGYPDDFDPSESPVRPVIDIVQAADCLDAATDTVGRSYSRGKTLDVYLAELKAGSGTHYAPWMHDLISVPEVYADLEYLLSAGRQNNYRNTYYLLREMQ